ncbi:hypothetical protein DMH26_33885 [Streptomyces sp. WAC 05379]|nr:hypothetical protein DMH26_33885 [Streptomyces sp. WAC 05379]
MPVFTRFRQPTSKNDDLTDKAPTDKNPSPDGQASPEPIPTADDKPSVDDGPVARRGLVGVGVGGLGVEGAVVC